MIYLVSTVSDRACNSYVGIIIVNIILQTRYFVLCPLNQMYCILSVSTKSDQQHASQQVIILGTKVAFGGKFCLQLYRQGFLVFNCPPPRLFIEHPCCIFT
jgi:hypothetical protein